MKLSNDLISQFVKVTADNDKTKKETTVYGTVVKQGSSTFVKLDGSESLTPVSSTTVVKNGERVTVMIKNHTAVITGNISSPSAQDSEVQTIGNKITEMEIVVADKVSAKELDAEKGRIDDLVANNVLIKDRLTANETITQTLTADNVTIKNKLEANEILTKKLETEKLDATIADIKFATIESLEVTDQKVHNLEGDYGEFKVLATDKFEANEARFKTIETEKISANEADLKYATINELRSDYVKTTTFEALNGKVGTMDIDIGRINTLISGSVSAGSTQTIVLNADNTTIANALIKSAMIESLSFNKIIGVDINTTNIKVHSSDGLSQWTNNTIQISDLNRIRVQIGRDASNDYNLYVWDALGNLMFDATGVTSKGIQKPIIVDSMVAGDANISGDKINITSVIHKINANSTLIESSHILYDGKSLDVAFNGMATSVSTVTKTITDNKSKWDLASTEASNALSKATSIETRANNGEFDGKGVATTNVTYQASTSGTTAPTGTWTATIPAVNPGQYLWTRTIITYTDNTSTTSYSVARMGANGTGTKGDKGDTGNGISGITSYYLASASSSGVTTSTEGWTTTPQSVTTSKKYHWNYQVITYTNGSTTTTTPAIIGVYGDTGAKGATGATGKGISSVVPQYYLSTSNTAQSGGAWKTTQDAWSSGKYYWTRDAITWSDSSTTYTTPVLDNGLNNANATASSALTKVTTVTETVNSHSTQITAQEGKIATLITDTSQVKQDITAVQGEVTTAKGNITTLQNNYSSLQQTVSGLNSTVGSHSSQLTTIKGTADSALNLINGLQIGVRNLVPHSDKLGGYCMPVGSATFAVTYVDDEDALSRKHIEFKCTAEGTGFHTPVFSKTPSRIGKKYTWSFWAKCSVNKSGNVGSETGGRTSISLTTSWQYYTYTWVMQDSEYYSFTWYLGYKVNEILYIRDFKIEEGTKPSPWTPAVEDINESINTVNSRITSEIKTVTDKQSSFEQSLTAITGRVSSVESTTSSVKSTVDTNKANWDKAPTALSTANTAKSTADTAKSTADQANTTATTASTNASTAVSTANTAKTTADSAKSAATTATNTANTAKSTADSAKSTATTANTTANSALLATKVTPLSGSAKLFKNVASYSNDNQNLKGAFVIVTPILPSKMCRFRITGYNYVSGTNNDIDLTITGYNYGDSIVNYSYSNAGNVLFSSVKLAKVSATDKRLVIILGGVSDTWQYPKIYVDSALISYSGVAPDSYKDGWSISLVTTLSTAYVHTVTVPGMNVQSEITTVKTKESALELTVDQFKTTVSNTYATKTQLNTVDGKFANYATTSAMNSAITQKANEITTSVSNTYATKTTVNTKVDKTLPDTRNDNQNPQWYYTNYPRQIIREFKYANRIGIGTSGVYGVLETYIPWTDSSGGLPTQVFYSNSTGTYERVATSTTAWGAWKKSEDTAGSQAKADTVKNYVTSNYSTTTAMNAAIKTSADSITNTVSKTYATQTSLNSLTTRVTTAESKLTATSLITTISSGLQGSNSLTTTKFVMDKNGLHIKGGGFDIANNAGTKVLSADSSGNLTMTGTINATSGKIGNFSLDNGNLTTQYRTSESAPSYIVLNADSVELFRSGSFCDITSYEISVGSEIGIITINGGTGTVTVPRTVICETIESGFISCSYGNEITFTSTTTTLWFGYRAGAIGNKIADWYFGNGTSGGQGTIHCNTIELAGTAYVSNWFRSRGNNGWYSETYAGGIYMIDSTYVRTYNNKGFLASGASWLASEYLTNGWIGFYNALGGTRKGWIGHGDSGGTDFYLRNEASGIIDLKASNGNQIQYLKEASGSQRTLWRCATNGGAYLGTTGFRWNTAFFTNAITTSDLKEKQVLPSYDMRTREFIMSVKPIAYHRIGAGDTGKRIHFGFGAQTVAQTINSLNLGNLSMVQASIINPDGTESPYHGEPIDDSRLSWGINYNEFIPPMVSMLQLHERDIQDVKQEISYNKQEFDYKITKNNEMLKQQYKQEIWQLNQRILSLESKLSELRS